MSRPLNGSPARFAAAGASRLSRDAVYRAVWRWHFYAGLLCLPFLVLLAATGALYLFKDEVNGAFHPERVVALRASAPLSPDRLLFNAGEAVPGATPVLYADPSAPNGPAVVTMAEGARRTLVYLDPSTGDVLGRAERDDAFMMVVRRLHSLAYFGPVANALVEVVAGFAILLVVTGTYLWWPRPTAPAVLRPRGPPARRQWWRDLHAVTGLVAGGGLFFLAITGLPWSVWWGQQVRALSNEAGLGQPRSLWADKAVSAMPMRAVLPEAGWAMQDAPVPLSRNAASAPAIGLGQAVAALRARGMPEGFEVALPVGETGVYAASAYPRDVTRQRLISLDQYSGAPIVDVRFADLGPVAKAIQYGIGIHKGEHFGPANQFLMLAFCLATILLCVTGAVMWWKRRPQGSLGVPPWPRDRKVVATVTGLVALCGALFPLTGLALLVLIAGDLAIQALRRVPRRPAAA